MNNLKHIGWVFHIVLEAGQTTTFFFDREEDALDYCKAKYPNTIFQIIPIPIFKFERKKNDG